MVNFVDTFKNRIQSATLTAIDSIVTPKIELLFRSINASSGRDATNFVASSELGEQIEVTAPFENASENKIVLHISKVNDETRNKIPNEVSELSVPDALFNQQLHTHHNNLCMTQLLAK